MIPKQNNYGLDYSKKYMYLFGTQLSNWNVLAAYLILCINVAYNQNQNSTSFLTIKGHPVLRILKLYTSTYNISNRCSALWATEVIITVHEPLNFRSIHSGIFSFLWKITDFELQLQKFMFTETITLFVNINRHYIIKEYSEKFRQLFLNRP